MTSKDLDQPVYPPSITKVLDYPILDSPEDVEDTSNQQRLLSDSADAQVNLSLRWLHVLL